MALFPPALPSGLKAVAVGYLRRSTDRQEQSIPDQRKAVEQYAAQRGLRMAKFYVDDAISGTSAIGRRAFQEMIADAQRPQRPFTLIVVYDVKRFGRLDNDEAGYYRHVLRQHGVEVCYVSENFNGDGTDDLLRPVKQWQAREESKDLSKVTIRGLLSKVGGGWWMGGVPPHGYDLRYENADGKFLLVLRHRPDGSKQVLDEKGRETRRLARGESLSISKRDRAKLVLSEPHRVKSIVEIFRLYVKEKRGFKAIADALNRRGLPTPRGPAWATIYSGQWTDTTIRAILVNPIYTGDMVWNRRTDGRFHRIEENRATPRQKVHAARLEPNQPSNWITVRDTHPAIVPRRLFEQARQIRESRPATENQQRPRHVSGGWHGTRSRFVLSGLLKCAHCGSRYQGLTRQKSKHRTDGSVVKTYYYGCGGYITKGASICQLGPIPQETLEKAVIERPFIRNNSRLRSEFALNARFEEELNDTDREDAANVILFLCHIDPTPLVIDEMLANAAKIFDGEKETDLTTDVEFTGDLVVRLNQPVIESGDPEKRRQQKLEAQDALVRDSDPSDDMYQYKREDETDLDSETQIPSHTS